MARELLKGNEAIAEAAVRAGLDAYFGYPITPQTELLEYMARRMPELGRVFVQAESEVAAINMVYGAACAGKRAMTSSSSPGISLMQEGLSYIAGSEVPAVIVDVMRGGPGLGNIAPSQADYFQMVKMAGHGDFQPIVLAPATVQEAIDLTVLAFDLAEKYRTIVTVLLDGNARPDDGAGRAAAHAIALGATPPVGAARRRAAARNGIISSIHLAAGGAGDSSTSDLQAKLRPIAANEVRCQRLHAGRRRSGRRRVRHGRAGRADRGQDRARSRASRSVCSGRSRSGPSRRARLSQLAGQARAFLVVEMNAGQMLDDVRLAVAGHVPGASSTGAWAAWCRCPMRSWRRLPGSTSRTARTAATRVVDSQEGRSNE